jgi:hypothetical protein
MTRSSERRIERDECKCDDRHSCRGQQNAFRCECEPASAKCKDGECGTEDEHAAAVGSRGAPANGEEHECGKREEPPLTDQHGCGDYRREEQRLELVADAVETPAAVRPCAEDTERIQLRVGHEHREEDDQESRDREWNESPP